MNKKNIHIITSVITLSLSVTFIDAVIKPNYFTKIPIKIIAFLALPMLYFLFNQKEFQEFKKMFTPKKKDILKSISIGIPIYLFIVIGYFLTKNIIDYSNVAPNLNNSMGITSNNYIYVALYIPLLNSFLEEFFFRGYSFITLKKNTSRKFAYIFSSTLFSIYHIGMLLGSFSLVVIILLLLGIFLAGTIFNYLNESNDNIYVSWLVHMFANFAMVTVGFILFEIL